MHGARLMCPGFGAVETLVDTIWYAAGATRSSASPPESRFAPTDFGGWMSGRWWVEFRPVPVMKPSRRSGLYWKLLSRLRMKVWSRSRVPVARLAKAVLEVGSDPFDGVQVCCVGRQDYEGQPLRRARRGCQSDCVSLGMARPVGVPAVVAVSGSWSSGTTTPRSPPTTGSVPCLPIPTWPTWYAWRKSAGASKTTTENSNTAWTRTRAAATPAGTATSPPPPPPRPSAPCCAATPEPLRQPDRLPGSARAAGHPGDVDRHLPHLHQNSHPCRPRNEHLT